MLAGSADVVLYEPAFSFRDVLVRLDVLARKGGLGHLVEVKSATAVRPHHVTDAAIQAWVVKGSGVSVGVVSVAHIDTSFVYPGDGRYEGLLREVDVTAQAQAAAQRLPGLVRGLQRMAGGPAPLVAPGAQCGDPFRCPFVGVCGNAAAAGAGARRAPAEPAAAAAGGHELAASLERRFGDLPFPRAGLALVSANPAVPVWRGTRPYEHVPLAWSCHLRRRPADTVEQAGFVADSAEPSPRAFATSLLATLGGQRGSVLVRGPAAGEQLRGLAARLPRLARGLQAIGKQLVDIDQIVYRADAGSPTGAPRRSPATPRRAPPATPPSSGRLSSTTSTGSRQPRLSSSWPAAGSLSGGGLAEVSGHAAGSGLGQASFADLPEAVASRYAAVRAALAAAVARESQALLELASSRAGERG